MSRRQLYALGVTRDVMRAHVRARRWEDSAQQRCTGCATGTARTSRCSCTTTVLRADQGRAAYERHQRTAHGAVAAVVQQGLTPPGRLRDQLRRMTPLRRAQQLRALLADLEGGAQSVAEIDVRRACRRCGVVPPVRQRPRRDRDGRKRWTDCEWDLPDGRVVVLEVDGAHHLEVMQYSDDMKRQRKLTTLQRIIVRCSAYEIRHDPASVMDDLLALGVPRTRAG